MSFVNLIVLIGLSFVNLILLLSPAQGRRDIELHVTHRALLFLGDATPHGNPVRTRMHHPQPSGVFQTFTRGQG